MKAILAVAIIALFALALSAEEKFARTHQELSAVYKLLTDLEVKLAKQLTASNDLVAQKEAALKSATDTRNAKEREYNTALDALNAAKKTQEAAQSALTTAQSQRDNLVETIRKELLLIKKLKEILGAHHCDDLLFEGNCFKVVKSDVDFKGALDACNAWGGFPASIDNNRQNAFVQARIQGCSATWLGGSDALKEGTWKWLDGNAWTYSNWAPGEPNNYNQEHQLEMYDDGRWNDIAASTRGRAHCYVCKKNGFTSDGQHCTIGNGGCSADATCSQSPSGQVSCTCKSGFTGNGFTCQDINECASNNGGCDANAVCTNTVGSRTCTCKSGFTGNGLTCQDINECATNNGGCNANAICTNTAGSRTCACKQGFSGDGFNCVQTCDGVRSGRGKCYKVVTNQVDYGTATSLCRQWGGSLASVSSPEENEIIRSRIGGCHTWIGGTDAGTEGRWRWMDGTGWGYSNWAPGEPNNYTGEDLLEMYPDGRWNDIATKFRGAACYACSK